MNKFVFYNTQSDAIIIHDPVDKLMISEFDELEEMEELHMMLFCHLVQSESIVYIGEL